TPCARRAVPVGHRTPEPGALLEPVEGTITQGLQSVEPLCGQRRDRRQQMSRPGKICSRSFPHSCENNVDIQHDAARYSMAYLLQPFACIIRCMLARAL